MFRLIYLFTLLLFFSVAAAENEPNTLSIKFENEQQPTSDAGVGPGMDVVRSGENLFMLQERNFVILSIKDPAHPKVIGKLEKVGNLRQIAIRGDIAYITAREDGLFVIDISDRTAPKILSRYDTTEFATGIALDGDYAFVAQRWFGVEIIDIANPEKLRHVSGIRVGEAQSCVVSDGFLYAGAWGESRVAICDVRNPADPKQVANIKLNGRGDGLWVEKGILYAAYGHHQPGANLYLDDPRYGNGNGMEIFDVSNPTEPKHLSRVQLDWRYYYGWPDTWRVKLAFPYAYLYHTHNGVFILDVSDPKEPKELAQIRIPRYPGEKGYRKLKTEDKSGSRPVAIPFDPKKVSYSPVCGLESVDGYLYFTGLFTDLHLYKNEKLAKAIPTIEEKTTELIKTGDFHDFKALEKYDLKDLSTYRPGGQVYAATEHNKNIYAACGSDGIHVLDKQLNLLKKHPIEGFAMDVQVSGNKLYVAQGFGGLASYTISNTDLQKTATYQSTMSVNQVQISPNEKFAVIHAGGKGFEILDLTQEGKITHQENIRGWGGLVYYRQLCNGFIDDRYICGTWCAGRTFMTDLSADKPSHLADPTNLLPDMSRGGYCALGEYALLTRKGGYSFYKPLLEDNYKEMPVYKIKGGPDFYGKPTVRGNILITCDRIHGDITVVDISDKKNPKLIRQFRITGNPDLAYIGEDYLLIPAGRQGLIKFSL